MGIQSFDMFPTRTWLFGLDELLPELPGWLREIEAWRSTDATLASSNRNGWTSTKTVLSRPAFAPLEQAARRCFQHALGESALLEEPALRIEGWVNYQDRGGFNHFHVHGTAALAGAFYLQVPEGSGDIIFRDPRPGIALVGLKGNGANCQSVTGHTPRVGEFVVFPGWLEHGVDPHAAATPRISIAINCYLERTPAS